MDRSSLLILAVLFLIGVFDAQAFMRMPQRASYRTLQGKAGGVCKSLQVSIFTVCKFPDEHSMVTK